MVEMNDANVASEQPSASDLRDAIRYMDRVRREVTYTEHPSGVIAAESPIPGDESGSVEVTYGVDHVTAFVSLALTLRHNDLHRSVVTESHAEYPHEEGYLIGCGACEAKCHCRDGEFAVCVWPGHDEAEALDPRTLAAEDDTPRCDECGDPIDYCLGHGGWNEYGFYCPEFEEAGSCIHSDHMTLAGR